MRTVFCLFISFFAYSAYSQDTLYLDNLYQEINKSSSYDYYKVIQGINNDTIVRTYNRSGILLSEDIFSGYSKYIHHGLSKKWFDNSLLKEQISYKEGKIDGFLRTFWHSGKPKRVDFYKKDICINGTCFDSAGVKIEHFDYQIKPEFPGGEAELIKFIAEKTKYPIDALEQGIEGVIYVRFVVTKSGNVSQVKVMRAVNPILENEALSVVKSLPKWQPGYIDGDLVNVWYIIPVKFMLQ